MLNYEWLKEPVLGNSLQHIISRLLTFDPLDRLGYSGTSQVMEHPWLSHVDWAWMRHRTYEVRSKPKAWFLLRHETGEAPCATFWRSFGDLQWMIIRHLGSRVGRNPPASGTRGQCLLRVQWEI